MNEADLKQLWLRQPVPALAGQPGGHAAMNKKMRKFDRTIFWRDCRELVACVIVAIWYGWYFVRYTATLARVGCAMTVASAVFIGWRMISSKRKAGKTAPDDAVVDALQVELRKVNNQIGLLRSVLWWYLLPLAVGALTFQFAVVPDAMGRAISVFVWMVLIVVLDWVNQCAVRKKLLPLKNELESLVGIPPQIEPTMKTNLFKKMFLTLMIIGSVTALLWTAYRAVATENPPAEPQIRSMLQTCVDEQKRAPGIAIAVVDEHGARFYSRGFHDGADSAAVDENTIFEIGSISKVFTAETLQAMVDRGEVRLDDPISKFLPPNVKVPSRNGRQITLLDLATQTSGLLRLPDNLNPRDEHNPYADYTVAQLYEFLSNYKLDRDIGKKYEYSNLGGGLLGHVLALRAGVSYEELVKKTICDPLHLDSTRVTLGPDLKARLATGHDTYGDAVENWDMPTLAGAGGLRSTARDLAAFVSANLGLGKTSLSNAMMEAQKPRHGAGGLTRKIGLMWQIDTLHNTIWHNGGTGGYRSFIGFKPAKHFGVVVLGNSENDVDDIGGYLLGDKAEVDDFTAPKKRTAIHVDHKLLDAYAGVYKFPLVNVTMTYTRDGDHFYGQMTGQGKIEFFPETQVDFFTKVVDAQVTFETNSTGAPTAVVLHQNGMDQKAKRVK